MLLLRGSSPLQQPRLFPSFRILVWAFPCSTHHDVWWTTLCSLSGRPPQTVISMRAGPFSAYSRLYAQRAVQHLTQIHICWRNEGVLNITTDVQVASTSPADTHKVCSRLWIVKALPPVQLYLAMHRPMTCYRYSFRLSLHFITLI